MRTISGLFETYQKATEAVHALRDAGVKTADISLIANSPQDLTPDENVIGKDTTAGAEVGALLGGAGGLLAGLGVLAIPGIGPVIAGGWLVATVLGAVAGAGLGAATGGLIGLLTDAGVPKSDAHVYAEGVRRGGALVTARVTEMQAEEAEGVLRRMGAADVGALRASYEGEGWSGYEEVTSPPGEPRDPRASPPLVPPI
jgi:hypothetical protein